MTSKTFWVFIILLLILVVLTMMASGREGFSMNLGTNFNVFSKMSDYSTTYQYVTRITDDIYYNYMNGIFFLVPFTKETDKDPKITGQIKAFKRNGTALSYTHDNVNKEVSDVLKSVTLDTLNDPVTIQINSFDKKEQVVAVSYGKRTFIVLMTGMGTQGYEISRLMIYDNQKADSDTATSWSVGQLQTSWTDPDTADTDKASNGKEIKEEMYDNTNKLVYRVKQNILYDKANGNLLIVSPAVAANATATPPVTASPKKVKVYKRNYGKTGIIGTDDKPSYEYTSVAPVNDHTEASGITTLRDTASVAIVVREPITKRTVLYWSRNLDTVLLVFNDIYDATTGEVPIAQSLAVYAPVGSGSGGSSSGGSSGGGSSGEQKKEEDSDSEGEDKDKDTKSLEDEYMKWSQYMLKTQVVPPVCPSCPACPAAQSGVCTSCGGQGGSGTQSNTGSSLAFGSTTGTSTDTSTVKNTVNQASGAGVTGPSAALASVGQSAGSAVSNVAGTVGGAVGTVGNVANTAIGTAGNIVTGTVGTAGSLVSGTIGTAADLLHSAGSGLGNMLSGANDNATRVGYQQSYNRAGTGFNRNNTGYPPATSQYDAYSYGGALQSKGSNYRPITADFSAFAK